MGLAQALSVEQLANAPPAALRLYARNFCRTLAPRWLCTCVLVCLVYVCCPLCCPRTSVSQQLPAAAADYSSAGQHVFMVVPCVLQA